MLLMLRITRRECAPLITYIPESSWFTKEIVNLEPGMGFLPQIAIDRHFAQRGRLGMFVSALIQQPAVLSFGIDENTAIAVNGDQIEVIGEGAVTIS